MDLNDNSCRMNETPTDVQNCESNINPVNTNVSASPGEVKRSVAGSRPRPPLPQKPPVAKKPNIISGSQCLSKTPASCTDHKSTSTHSREFVHKHLSSSSPSLPNSEVNESSLSNNRLEGNNLSKFVSVKDRTKTLGLYAAGKSFFYIDQNVEHASPSQVNSSTNACDKNNACGHAIVSKKSRTKSGKFRLPLIGFPKNVESVSENNVKPMKSKWYTEFDSDDISKTDKEMTAPNKENIIITKNSTGDTDETQVQSSGIESSENIEAKPNFSETSNKTETPRPPIPKPSSRKVSHDPEVSPTSTPMPSNKVPPPPVPRKRRSILPKTSNDDSNISSEPPEKECQPENKASKDSEDPKNSPVCETKDGNKDKKESPNACLPENVENDKQSSNSPNLDKSNNLSDTGRVNANLVPRKRRSVLPKLTSDDVKQSPDSADEVDLVDKTSSHSQQDKNMPESENTDGNKENPIKCLPEVAECVKQSNKSLNLEKPDITSEDGTVNLADDSKKGFNTDHSSNQQDNDKNSDIVNMSRPTGIPPPVPQKTKRKPAKQKPVDSGKSKPTHENNDSKDVSSSIVTKETHEKHGTNEYHPNTESETSTGHNDTKIKTDTGTNDKCLVDSVKLEESNKSEDTNKEKQMDLTALKTDSHKVNLTDSVTFAEKQAQNSKMSPQINTDVQDNNFQSAGNDSFSHSDSVKLCESEDSFPQPDSVAQIPETCDMLKEIEDLLNQKLGDVGLFSDNILKDSSDDVSNDCEKSAWSSRPKSESFSSALPSRPPRPKRDASKKMKKVSSLDLQDSQHSDASSCDSASESQKKICPPKPKRTLPPRVNRSQSDVSGMKSLIVQLENSFDGSRPAVPPRNESQTFEEPPPLPPRNSFRCNSLDLSSKRPISLPEDFKNDATKTAPFAKPPRNVRRPSRKAPPPPSHPPGQTSDVTVTPGKLSASVCTTDKGLESEKRESYRKDGSVTEDHEYHEIPDSANKKDEEPTAPVKEITPPPELPPRSVNMKSASQTITSNGSDSGSIRSASNSKLESDDSSSVCSSQSSVSPVKPVDSAKPVDTSASESPSSVRANRPSSVSSTNSECGGSCENVSRMNDLSSASDDDDEDKQVNKKAKKTKYIAKEIMESEAVFVDVLKLLNIDFRVAVSKEIENIDRPVIPSETLNKILDYLPQLQSINEDLLKDIKDRLEHWDECPKIADVFVKKGPFLKLYSSYIRNFENATTLLDESCKKYASFAACVKEFERSPRCANLALKHYMLKPIQRIPQYRLLLQDYKKNLSEDSPDYNNTITALNIVSEVADHANESMRHGDEVQEMMEIQHSLIGQFEVIQPGRSLIKKGELMKLSRKEKQPRMFFLFTDVLLYTTPTATGYRLNNILPLIGMKVSSTDKPTADEYGNEFSILSVQRSFTISASTPKERTEWMTALTNAIKKMTERRDTFHSKEKGAQTFLLDKDFVLGHKAPLWVPDRRVTMCMLCLGEFTITWRRHHCRACGRIVCGYCSENKAPLRYLKYRPDRVCDECFEKLQKEIEDKEGSGETTEDVTFSSHEGATPAKVSLSTIKERFQKIRWSGRGRKKYAPSRAAVLKEVKANDEGSSMSGYLTMFRNRKWKRFWFVVKDKVLYTYKASEDMAAIESKPLLGFEVSRITEWFEGVEPDLVFQLTHPNTAPLIFRTESATATTKWITVMREASICTLA